MAGRDRLPLLALGFGLAAALSSWTPLSAPFGLVVGLAAALLAARALLRPGPRRLAAAALLVALAAAVASGVVLALAAGVGREVRGAPVVEEPGTAAGADLDRAEGRTREARERARTELDALGRAGGSRAPEGARDARARTR